MVFMQAFADFGTPMLMGEGFQTFPVLIYNQYLGEGGQNFNFAAALAMIAVIITAVVFGIQKFATSRFKFSMNALHPVEKKDAKGLSGFLMHLYCYVLVAVAFLPDVYKRQPFCLFTSPQLRLFPFWGKDKILAPGCR